MLIEVLARAFVFVVGVGFLAFGLLCVRAAVDNTWDWISAVRSARWPTVTGTVTRSVVAKVRSTRRHRPEFSPALAYTYEVRGQTYAGTRESFASDVYEVRAQAEEVVARFAKGISVVVHFNPGKPDTAVLDVRRPPAFRFIQVAFLMAAWIPLFGGAAVIKGDFDDSAPFPVAGLPPLRHQIAGLMLAIGVACALVAAIRLLLERRRRGLVRQIDAAPLAAIASVREGQSVSVCGRAAREGEEFIESPVSDQPVVYEHLRVSKGNDIEILTQISAGEIRVSDGSGSLLLLTKHAVDEVIPTILPNNQRVTDWVDESMQERQLSFSVEHRAIPEGGQILAVGVVKRDHKRNELVLRGAHASDRSILISDESRDELRRRLARGMICTWLLAGVAASLLLVGGFLMR